MAIDDSLERVVYLGDSLTDSDEFYRLAQILMNDPLPDADAGYAGQFSNGPMYADLMPDLLGLDGGDDLNFAVAGARAAGTRTVADFVDDPTLLKADADPALLAFDVNLGAQVGRLLAAAADPVTGFDLSTTAVDVWAGINDLATFSPSGIFFWEWDDQLSDLIDETVAAIRDNVLALDAAGVGAIWVGTLPELTFFPAYNDADFFTRYLSDGAIDAFNGKLEAMVDALPDDVPAAIVDIKLITDEIERDRFSFGFVSLETPVLDHYGDEYDPPRNVAPEDEGNYGFFDKLHPTTELHDVLAIFEATALSDNVIARGDAHDTIDATAGDDLVISGRGHDTVSLKGGDDVALAGTGNDYVSGDAGNDLIAGMAGDDTLVGGGGRNLLAGGRGDDDLHGGAGNDLFLPGLGSDVAAGGRGDDVFIWLDPQLEFGSLGDSDRIDGGKGRDTAVFYIADGALYDAAVADYAGSHGRTQAIDSLQVTLRGVETVEFVDLSHQPFELPATGDAVLDDLLADAALWGFV